MLASFPGTELAGLAYEPLWDFHSKSDEKIHFIVADDYVTAEEGTGIVHLALYGEDDYRLIRKNGLPIVQPIGLDGLFTAETGAYAGRHFVAEWRLRFSRIWRPTDCSSAGRGMSTVIHTVINVNQS